MEQYLQQLKRLSKENVKEGGSPYSALIVLDGHVVATGVNEAHRANDPTMHAELLAIQKAIQNGNNNQLKEATLYASGEPCPMCYSAAQYVGIKEIFYTVSREEIKAMNKLATFNEIPTHFKSDQAIKSCFEQW